MQRAQGRIITRMLDASGSPGELRLWMRDADVATASAAASQLRGWLAGLSDAVPQEQLIEYPGVVVPQPPAPGGAPAGRAALLVFSSSTDGAFATITIPALRPALLVASGPGAGILIDTAAPEVAALIATLTDGLYCNPFGAPLTELESAYMQVLP